MHHSIRHARRRPVMGIAAVMLLVLFVPWLIATPPPPSEAAYDNYNVGTADELIAALTSANLTPEDDTITLAADITLSAVLPPITTVITLEGAGHYIDGVNSYRVFEVTGIGDFTLNQVTIKQGAAGSGFGGGIYNAGKLTVIDCTFQDNKAHHGAAIYNGGTVTVTGTTFSNNDALCGALCQDSNGGAIDNRGMLAVTDSYFERNYAVYGAGIYNGDTLLVNNSTFRFNQGGAVYNDDTLNVNNSSFSFNMGSNTKYFVVISGFLGIAGGITNDSTATVTNSTFERNQGAISNNINDVRVPISFSFPFVFEFSAAMSYGTLVVTNSTFVENSAAIGSSLEAGAPGSVQNMGGTVHLAGNIFNSPGDANCAMYDGFQEGLGFKNPIDHGYNLSSDGTCASNGRGSQTDVALNLHWRYRVEREPAGQSVSPPHFPSLAVDAIPTGTTFNIKLNDNDTLVWACDGSYTDQLGQPCPLDSDFRCTAGAVEVNLCPEPDAISDERELSSCLYWANRKPGADTLTLDAGITLSAALTPIATPITLEGAGHYIHGVGSYRVLEVLSKGDLTINQVIIQQGNAGSGIGGGIKNAGTLTVTSSTFWGNTARWGAAIYNGSGSTVTVTDSVFDINIADWGEESGGGGGIDNHGTLTVTGSTFSNNEGNSGGGINNRGTLTLINSTLSDNSGVSDGGGIDNRGILNMTDSVFTGNKAPYGGGIFNDGTLTLTNSTLSDNRAGALGGGLFNGGNLNVTDSTFTDNEAFSGGGIDNRGILNVTSSTFSSNSAENSGGGVRNVGTLTLTNSTLSDNSAGASGGGIGVSVVDSTATITNSTLNGNMAPGNSGGIYCESGTVTMQNSIVANSPTGSNCAGTITDGGNNLSSDGTCGFSLLNTDPLLGPLADNGGPTLTHLPQPGSPAIDAGNNTVCADPDTVNNRDQRGEVRPFDGDGDATAVCDIGAVERRNTDLPPVLNINNVSGFESSAGTITFTVTRTHAKRTSQVNYTTADGTALAGSDYVEASGTLSFAQSVSSQTIVVHLRGDSQVESSEQFVVTLSNPQQAVIGDGQGQGTITNSTPILTKPANNAVTRDAMPTFTWNTISGAVRYQVQVDNNSNFTSPEFTVTRTVTNYTRPTTLANGKYYWHVRAQDAAGHWGGWSARWTFTIDTTPPAQPVMVSPANNATTPDTTPLFRWQAVAGATNYTLQVDNNNNFASPVINRTQTSTSAPTSELAQGRYYWRV